jgi:hypothetical protein
MSGPFPQFFLRGWADGAKFSDILQLDAVTKQLRNVLQHCGTGSFWIVAL